MENENVIKVKIKDIDLKFKTSNKVFSPKSIDKGTLAMLSVVDLNEFNKILDLGCGYGVVGILSAKLIGPQNVIMVDVDENAVEVSKENAILNDLEEIKIFQSNGLNNIDEKDFDLILSNPPYHEDFSVPKHFIEKGFNRLKVDGKIYMVTKRKEWYKNKLISVFGGVKIWEIDDYYVFMSIKKDNSYANVRKKKNKNSNKNSNKNNNKSKLKSKNKK